MHMEGTTRCPENQVLHVNAHYLQHDRPVQNEMQVESLGVMYNRDNLFGLRAWLT